MLIECHIDIPTVYIERINNILSMEHFHHKFEIGEVMLKMISFSSLKSRIIISLTNGQHKDESPYLTAELETSGKRAYFIQLKLKNIREGIWIGHNNIQYAIEIRENNDKITCDRFESIGRLFNKKLFGV